MLIRNNIWKKDYLRRISVKKQEQRTRKLGNSLLHVFIILSAFLLLQAAAFAIAPARPTMTVDMITKTGDIIHGAAGFLYGISSEGVPTTNMLIPLKPKVLSTKGALGTEHPYGDARDVARTFFEGGGEQIMMYNSNYYAIFQPTVTVEQYTSDLKNIIAPAVVEWKEQWKQDFNVDPVTGIDDLEINIDEATIYVPINENDPIVFASGSRSINDAWKSYYDAIKAVDPNARIAGPNDWGFFGYDYYRNFLRFCLANDCLPDVITWHELDREDLALIERNVKEYERACETVGIEPIQVVINEYATAQDTGVPGRLVNWIARLEDQKLYGCLPFWHMANNLNDLAAEVNEGNSAWWVYKWYGDMSGQTLEVRTSNTTYDGLYGLASIDDNKKRVAILFGGVDGSATIVLDNIDKTVPFFGASKVYVRVEASYYNGFHSSVSAPTLVSEGVFPVEKGRVVLEMTDMIASCAYNVLVSVADASAEVGEPLVGPYYRVYEAEEAELGSLARAEFVNAFYYVSNGGRVRIGLGGSLTYTMDVPIDGKYKLEFVYGHGDGTNTANELAHNPRNLVQTLTVNDSEPIEMVMRNTLSTDMTGAHVEYVDLTKGVNTIKISTSSFGTVVHDLLNVSYAGAYGKNLPQFNKVYEAENADFNTLGTTVMTTVTTKLDLPNYSRSGYVTGLNGSPVENGGGIRWNVIVEEGGLYNLILRYQTDIAGSVRVYLDNTTRTFSNKLAEVALKPTLGHWSDAVVTVYLQKGINIIDVDATVDVALDYMRVVQLENTEEVASLSQTIEAETGIPEDATEIKTGTTLVPDGTTYVVGLEGDINAATDLNKYLEYKVTVPTAGLYRMQIFQSNKDIFGTHAYNAKVIDKYLSIQVNDTEPQRYFFRNTFSNDTFKEQTIPIILSAGENTIKVFNDDSWYVYKGIANYSKDGNYNWYQDKPGDIRIKNYAPNIDKFVITPAVLSNPIYRDEEYTIVVNHTAGGVATVDANVVYPGENAKLNIVAYEEVLDVVINGVSKKADLIEVGEDSFTLEIPDVRNDIFAIVRFAEYQRDSEYRDGYITNAGFGTGDLTGWIGQGSTIGVGNELLDRYEGYYLELAGDATVKQHVSVPAGIYYLNVVSKASSETTGVASLFAKVNDELVTASLNTGPLYDETYIRLELEDQSNIELGVTSTALTGKVFVDSFNIESIEPVDSSKVDPRLEYFVDCGDHNPATLSPGDKFGVRNSQTDQLYGLDRATGFMWGVVDQPSDVAGGTDGVYTMWTWPHERETADNLPKTTTFRYARNQLENGISPRAITYKFELEPGVYNVEIGFGSTWNNSRNPMLYANKDLITEVLLGSNLNIGHNQNKKVNGQVVVAEGMNYLTIDVRSNDATININYIKIAKHSE